MTVLRTVSLISIVMALICALVIAIHLLAGNKQRMWIMNLVWPITALYSGPLGLWAYFAVGRQSAAKNKDKQQEKPFYQSTGVGALLRRA